MFLKAVYALLVWLIASIVFFLLGSLLISVGYVNLTTAGTFLRDYSGLIGFVAGLIYFVYGVSRPVVR